MSSNAESMDTGEGRGAGYGGCEGPEAMYVKLISSDGHEFVVKRDHALISGTIKAMLSGPGQFAENETNEVNFRSVLRKCLLIAPSSCHSQIKQPVVVALCSTI